MSGVAARLDALPSTLNPSLTRFVVYNTPYTRPLTLGHSITRPTARMLRIPSTEPGFVGSVLVSILRLTLIHS